MSLLCRLPVSAPRRGAMKADRRWRWSLGCLALLALSATRGSSAHAGTSQSGTPQTSTPQTSTSGDAVAAVRSFGLPGTWALDCGRPVSTDDPRVSYTVMSVPERVEHRFTTTAGDTTAGEVIVYAEVLGNDRMLVVMRGPAMPSTVSIIRRRGDGIQVEEVLSSAGKHLIANGTVAATGKASPVYRRCGD